MTVMKTITTQCVQACGLNSLVTFYRCQKPWYTRGELWQHKGRFRVYRCPKSNQITPAYLNSFLPIVLLFKEHRQQALNHGWANELDMLLSSFLFFLFFLGFGSNYSAHSNEMIGSPKLNSQSLDSAITPLSHAREIWAHHSLLYKVTRMHMTSCLGEGKSKLSLPSLGRLQPSS